MAPYNWFFTALIFLLIFNACKSKEVSFKSISIDGKLFIEKKTYDKKGNILTEELLDKDSVRNGFYKEYIEGRVKDSGNYINGKKEGVWLSYHSNGIMSDSTAFISGNHIGICTGWYNNGYMSDSSNWNADGTGVSIPRNLQRLGRGSLQTAAIIPRRATWGRDPGPGA